MTIPGNDKGCHVIFEFVGGCRDGEILESPLANPFYWISDHAELGKRFTVASEYAVDQILAGSPSDTGVPYEYEIVERRVVAQTIYVKALSTMRRCNR